MLQKLSQEVRNIYIKTSSHQLVGLHDHAPPELSLKKTGKLNFNEYVLIETDSVKMYFF